MGSGLPQGDPLSPVIYTLALEPLLAKLRRRLIGIHLSPSVHWQLGAFADDMVVGIQYDFDRRMVVQTLKEYELVSGGKLNWHKCERLIIGDGLWKTGADDSVVDNMEKQMRIVFRGEAVCYLGIWMSCYGTVL